MIASIRPVWLLFTAIMITPFLLFAYRGFGVIELALWVSALPAALLSWSWVKTAPRWLWAVAALFAYAALASFWSPSSRSTEVWVYLVLLLTGAPLLVHGKIRPELFLWAVFAATAVLLVDALSGNWIRSAAPPAQPALKDAVATGRGVTLALLLLPAAALISYRTGGWRLGRGMIILLGLAAASTPVQINGVVLMGGLLVMIGTAVSPKIGLRLVLGLGGLSLAMPFLLSAALPSVDVLSRIDILPDSFVHRLIIWRQVLDAWLTGNTLFGEGVRATSELSTGSDPITLASGVKVGTLSVHPHNFAIETLYELGLVGFTLLATVGFFAAREILRTDFPRDMAAAIAALIFGGIVVMSLDYSMWSEFLPCTIVVSAFAMRQVSGKSVS